MASGICGISSRKFSAVLKCFSSSFRRTGKLCKKICELIHTYQVDTSRLTFEITESTYVNNTEAVNQVIRRLKQLNIQISMDDFGSGYSSLNTLKDLLFNEVKIDRKFLGDSLTENTQIVLQEVFHMLKRMGKSIVCEGVETKEIAEFLKAEGCDEIQGFLYYRPMCQKDLKHFSIYKAKLPDSHIRELLWFSYYPLFPYFRSSTISLYLFLFNL